MSPVAVAIANAMLAIRRIRIGRRRSASASQSRVGARPWASFFPILIGVRIAADAISMARDYRNPTPMDAPQQLGYDSLVQML